MIGDENAITEMGGDDQTELATAAPHLDSKATRTTHHSRCQAKAALLA